MGITTPILRRVGSVPTFPSEEERDVHVPLLSIISGLQKPKPYLLNRRPGVTVTCPRQGRDFLESTGDIYNKRHLLLANRIAHMRSSYPFCVKIVNFSKLSYQLKKIQKIGVETPYAYRHTRLSPLPRRAYCVPAGTPDIEHKRRTPIRCGGGGAGYCFQLNKLTVNKVSRTESRYIS